MFMFNFAHAGHEHTETTGSVKAVTTQAESPNYGMYVGIAVGLSLLIIGVVLLTLSFKKKITS